MDPFSSMQEVDNIYGPFIAADAGTKGRGMILTKDVNEGEVLFRETALAYHFDDRPSTKGVNFKANSFSDWSIVALIADLVNRATEDPVTNNMLSLLSSERKSSTVIPQLEMFTTRSFPDAPLLNARQIEGIITINAYQVTHNYRRGTGLFVVASLFNHDAFPNAVLDLNGPVLTLTAKNALKAGTEVCVSYGTDSALLRRKWGI
jgi:hypothetical protein